MSRKTNHRKKENSLKLSEKVKMKMWLKHTLRKKFFDIRELQSEKRFI
jgi:hypothetical protein